MARTIQISFLPPTGVLENKKREKVTGSFEWLKNYAIVSPWSFSIYAPDGSTALTWSGTDLEHYFNFTSTTSGTYKVEILKRDALPGCGKVDN